MIDSKLLDAKSVQASSTEELLRQLDGNAQGLTEAEAQRRATQFGPNRLAEVQKSLLAKLLHYFWGPIPWMIEAAALLSGLIRHWADFIIIILLLLFNAAVGFWQEYKASNALDALKAQLALKCRVRRGGAWKQVDASELVPGDIVRVMLGDVIPADIKLLEGDYISVDQSALTGESLPVDCKVGDVVYSASIAKQGEMVGVVYATGEHTYLGQDRATGAEGRRGFALPEGGAEHRRLSDLHQHRAGGRAGAGGTFARPVVGGTAAIRADPHRRLDSGGDAGGAVGHDGARRAGAVEGEGDRVAAGIDRGDGRRRHPVLGQDRDADAEQADPRRNVAVRRR